jgi:hypothetical protein
MSKLKTWPTWRVVAGPQLTAIEEHCAVVSDRDPKTGRSSVEEIEARNLEALVAAGRVAKPPKAAA